MRRRGLCVICHVGPGQLNPSAPLFSRAAEGSSGSQPLPAFPAIGNGPCRIGPASDGAASAELPAAMHTRHAVNVLFCRVHRTVWTFGRGPPAPVWPHPINAGPNLGPRPTGRLVRVFARYLHAYLRYLHLQVPSSPITSMSAGQQPN